MGRRSIPIEPLTEARNRSVTFMKRKHGLVKKAMELSILCGCEISLVIFHPNNKLYEYATDTVDKVMDRRAKFPSDGERVIKSNKDFESMCRKGQGMSPSPRQTANVLTTASSSDTKSDGSDMDTSASNTSQSPEKPTEAVLVSTLPSRSTTIEIVNATQSSTDGTLATATATATAASVPVANKKQAKKNKKNVKRRSDSASVTISAAATEQVSKRSRPSLKVETSPTKLEEMANDDKEKENSPVQAFEAQWTSIGGRAVASKNWKVESWVVPKDASSLSVANDNELNKDSVQLIDPADTLKND